MSGVVIVTGGRYYADWRHVYAVLNRLHAEQPIEILIHGACPYRPGGADFLAEDWARENEVSFMGIPAKFRRYGDPAGPRRNEDVLRWHGLEARLVAFPGGRGTNGTVAIAERLNAEENYGIRITDEREVA